MTSPHKSATGGRLDAEISNAIVGLIREHVGRGPTKARTTHSGKVVLCVLEQTMTQAERTLVTAGEDDFVIRMRFALQHAMRHELTAAVERLTRRKVVAFMSTNHVEPDLAAEVFVLEEPFLKSADSTPTVERL